MFKKTKLYVAISLLVQSVSFIALFFVFLCKDKKRTASAFLTLGAFGGIAGTLLLLQQKNEESFEDDLDFEDFDDDFFADGSPDDISCTIEGEEEKTEE